MVIMKKKRTLIIILTVLIFCLILGALFFITRYFVNYAIKSDTNGVPVKEAKKADNYLEYMSDYDFEEVEITSDDNLKLKGFIFNQEEETDKWVITIHGYKSDHNMMMVYAKSFYENGYNVLMPDLRGQGYSEGEYIGMGWLDRDDIMKWIDFIISKNEDAKIILHGVSMGGATVMMTSSMDLPDNVICGIEDCGYTSVDEIFASELKKQFKLPKAPFVKLGSIYSSIVVGYDWYEASAIKSVNKSNIPLLFIHGDSDYFVPSYMVYDVYEAAMCEKNAFVAKGASHTNAVKVDPDAYWDKCFGFINQYLDEAGDK